MMSAAFTPAPWLIHAERRWVVPAEDALKEPAEALPICQLRDPDERLTEDETLANGFLIAAAPELYEALSYTLALARLKFGNLDPDANTLFAKAETVLAKARGEA